MVEGISWFKFKGLRDHGRDNSRSKYIGRTDERRTESLPTECSKTERASDVNEFVTKQSMVWEEKKKKNNEMNGKNH